MTHDGFEKEERNGALVLKPLPGEHAGRLAALQACMRALEGRQQTLVVLDLSAVPELSSADLGVLVALNHVIRGARGRLRLAGLNTEARAALESTGLANQLPVFADVRAALA
jgi:anti-anti-sigma factor